MVTKTQAIKNFLTMSTHDDLASLYNYNMECQVNVAQDGGERIEGTFMGNKWNGWSNEHGETWKPFRIPYNAATNPEYDDKPMTFDLTKHANGIGMTGWDWKNKVSKWVAFDFDSIINHENGISPQDMEAVRKSCMDIPWVTIRKSTSGTGLHLYVLIDDVPSQTHTEHSALARAILSKMSGIVGFNFESKVDCMGGNMWVWHRKMSTSDGGLKLVKQGTTLPEPPHNWRDHIKVISGTKRRKNLNQNIDDTSPEGLSATRPKIRLDEDHRKLITYLEESDSLWWWDPDHNMLVTHSYVLKQAHEQLALKGFYETESKGNDLNEQNVFCFPLRGGGWSVRRYTMGAREHDSWDQDAGGWTRTYINVVPDFKRACRAYGGVEDTKGGFQFREAEIAVQAASLLGIHVKFAPHLNLRNCTLKQHKDGRLIVAVNREVTDPPDKMEGWMAEGNKPWTRIYNTKIATSPETDTAYVDDVVRHVITETNEDYDWFLKIDDNWVSQNLQNIKVALKSMGLNQKEIDNTLGVSVFQSFKLVNQPFQSEYPGDRKWNRNAAKLKFAASEDTDNLHHPTWTKVLRHCGQSLDEAIKEHPWCRTNGIINGTDYLRCWIASLLQEPMEPLPYLFFYGPQDSGKTTFHEALELMFTSGYKLADAAIVNPSTFNAELENAIVCVVEEINIGKNQTAYNRIKDWVTSRTLLIHPKGKTPYQIPNSTHWIQCSNDHTACPVFPGDTRITMCYVPELSPLDLIPKKKLIQRLIAEAPDFIASVLNLELPECQDRLNVPIVSTGDKLTVQESNESMLEVYMKQEYVSCNGSMVKFSEVYDGFMSWLSGDDINHWSKIKFGKELHPSKYPKARSARDAQFYIGNIKPKDDIETQPSAKLVVKKNGSNEYLVPLKEN